MTKKNAETFVSIIAFVVIVGLLRLDKSIFGFENMVITAFAAILSRNIIKDIKADRE
jgi:hypothetical protein